MGFFENIRQAAVNAWASLTGNIDKIIICILEIALIIIAAHIIRRIVVLIIDRALKRKIAKQPDSLTSKKFNTFNALIKNISRYVILFLEVTAILSVLGLGTTVTSLLTTAGIGGLAIGLGAQSLIGDAANGFFLLLDDEFAVGDYVEICDIKGTVISLTARTTRLRLANNEIATIPNGKISTVINYTRDSYLLFVDFRVSSEEDTQKAGKIMLNTLKAYSKENEFCEGEPAFLGAIDICASSQLLRASTPVNPKMQWQASRELNALLLKAFKENGIKLPEGKETIVVKDVSSHV